MKHSPETVRLPMGIRMCVPMQEILNLAGRFWAKLYKGEISKLQSSYCFLENIWPGVEWPLDVVVLQKELQCELAQGTGVGTHRCSVSAFADKQA